VRDLHLLGKKDYEYLMDTVDLIRKAMLSVLKLKKVYLVYMDEANHVHWHLVPRRSRMGFNILRDKPGELKDFSLAGKLREELPKVKI
jgi:diadenosine tetraphosphate (Ap4A) HIT family hydrolase